MDDATKEALCRHYGFGSVLDCTRLGGTRNHNFLVHTSAGKWFVRRRFLGYCHPARVAFDNCVLEFLCEHGVPVIPPRKTAAGAQQWRDGDHVWQVFPFVAGRAPREGSPGDAEALGAALAHCHEVGASFPLNYDKLGPRGETGPSLMLNQAGEIERDSPDCAAPLLRYRDWIASAQQSLSDALFSSLPHTLVHGDIQPANILVHRGRVAAFVDLDWCAWRPRIYDLAFAVLFCCSTHETPIQGADIWSLTQPPRVEMRVVEAFMKTYQDRAPRLGNEEFRAFEAQVALTWCHCRLAGALKVAPDDRARFLSRGPHSVDQLFPGLPTA